MQQLVRPMESDLSILPVMPLDKAVRKVRNREGGDAHAAYAGDHHDARGFDFEGNVSARRADPPAIHGGSARLIKVSARREDGN
jgi:hypothetical protein